MRYRPMSPITIVLTVLVPFTEVVLLLAALVVAS